MPACEEDRMAETVGVLGSGMVAQVLGAGFSGKGYAVRMGSRRVRFAR